MSIEFYSLVFPNVGEMYTDTTDPFARVKVRLYFRDVATDICTPIEIDTKITYRPHSTITDIYASALTEVKKVIGADHLVAIGHVGLGAEKERTVVVEPVEPAARLSGQHLDMLGGDAVGLGRHIVIVAAQDDFAIVAPGDPGDIGGWQYAELPVNLRDRRLRERLRGRQ